MRLPPKAIPNGRILVVDDDETMRELLALHLIGAGYEVDLAEDAIVAGNLLLKRLPDLLLVDVEMPYWNGLDFAAAVRADSATMYIPVIVMTAHEPHAQRARRLGLDTLLKPFMKDDLLDLVGHKLRAATIADETPTFVLRPTASRLRIASARPL